MNAQVGNIVQLTVDPPITSFVIPWPEKPVALYLEAHVTIEPVFDERREEAAAIAREHGFRLAELLMKKRANDTAMRAATDTCMTGHSQYRSDIEKRTKDVINALKDAGFKVWRYKIEDTLLDSRHEDIWGLLYDR